MPRTVIFEPSSLNRSIETPGIRANASARFCSGNLPISSALMASTTPVALRLTATAEVKLARMPVTTTSSRVSAGAFCAQVADEADIANASATARATGVFNE